MVFAACINLFFFFCLYNPNVYFAITQAHGQVGYNFYTYNSVQLDPQMAAYMEVAMRAEQRLIDYDRVRDAQFEEPMNRFL